MKSRRKPRPDPIATPGAPCGHGRVLRLGGDALGSPPGRICRWWWEGDPGNRGVVTTASYPARVFGVRSGMALAEASTAMSRTSWCSRWIPPRYIHESLAVLAILDRISPRVEPASIDEAYLEMPPVPPARWRERADRGGGPGAARGGRRTRARLLGGGGDQQAPGQDGLEAGQTRRGAGPGAAAFSGGVRTARGGRRSPGWARARWTPWPGWESAPSTIWPERPPERLQGPFGKWGAAMRAHARGEDASRGSGRRGGGRAPKTAGHETTFARDVSDARELRATLWLLADRVARRLRRHGLAAGTAVVKFKVGKNRYSRQRALPRPVDDARSLALPAWDLLEPARRGRAASAGGGGRGRSRPASRRKACSFPRTGDGGHDRRDGGDRLRRSVRGTAAIVSGGICPGTLGRGNRPTVKRAGRIRSRGRPS